MTVPDIAGAVTIPVPNVTTTVTAPHANQDPTGNGNRVFTQDEVNDLLNGARQQEKDKLYGRLSKVEELEAKFNTLAEERAAAEQAKADAEAAARAAEEKAERERAEAEMSAKQYADERSNELLTQLEAMRAERELERAAFEKERAYSELMAYRAQKMAEASEDIAPELLDFVSGNTPAEIDNSVELLRAKTAQIVENMLAAQQGMSPPRPVSPTGRPNTDPFGGDATKTYSVDQLREMPMSEYAAIRTQLLGAASAQYRQGQGTR